MFKSSKDKGTLMLCCMLLYLKTVTVSFKVRISTLILVTHVCSVVIYKRFELN